MPIRAGKSRTLGTAVEHDIAMPLTAGFVAVIPLGSIVEELLPDGTVYWGGEDVKHDLVGSGTEVLLFLVVVLRLGRGLVTRLVARRS
jgi:hypothetical protein